MIRDAAAGVRANGFAILVVDEDQVDIGRHIQFAAAQLAHANDEQVLRHSVSADRRAVVGRQFARLSRDGRLDRELGKRGHRGNDFRQLGSPTCIASD